MILTPHMLAGAAIGAHSQNVWIVIVLSLVSHYLFDSLAHWEYLYRVNVKNPDHLKKIAIDLVLGICLIIIMAGSHPNKYYILLGAFMALLPDGLEFLYKMFKIELLKPLSDFHESIHSKKRFDFLSGLPGLLLIIVISVLLLL